MADYVDFLEVGVGLNDRELMTGIREAETKVDKFAKNVEKKSPALEVSLNDLKFKNGVKMVNLAIKELGRKEATVAIKADTKGFLRAYAQVRLQMAAIRTAGSQLDRNFAGWAKGGLASWHQKISAKGPFQNFMRGVGGMRVQMGFFSTTVRQAVSVLTAFGPVIEGVIGSMTSLVGTMGSALVGASAAAGAGLAGMVATLGLVKAAIAPTVQGVDAAVKAQKAYATQVQKTGQDSDKAKKKLEELNSTMAHVPASSRDAIRTWATVTTRFREMTRASAEKGVGQVLNAGAQTAKKLMPAAARQTNQAIGTIGGAAQSAGKAIRGDEISGQIDTIMGGFNRALPSLLKGFGQLGALMLRIFAAASPAMVGLVKSFAEWATSLNNANKDSSVLGQTIDRQVDRFRNLVGLLSAVGGLFKTIFGAGAKDGDDMVVTLTKIINGWNKFLQSAGGQNKMAEFFAHARVVAGQFGSVLVTGVGIIGRYIEATRPLAAAILSFVAGLGKAVAWLQQIPGAGPILQLGIGFALVANKLGFLGKIITGLIPVFRVLFGLMTASPIGLVVVAIAALAAGAIYAYKHFETFRNVVDTTFNALKSIASAVIPVVASIVTGGVSSMVAAVASNLPRIRAIFSAVWNGVKAVVAAVWPVIKQIINGALQVIRGVIQVFSSAIKGDFRGMWEGIKNIFVGQIKVVTAVLKGAVGVFTSVAGAIGEAIKNSISKGIEGVVGIVSGVVNKIIGVLNKIPGVNITPLAQGGRLAGAGTATPGTGPATAKFARGGRTGSMQAAQEGGIVTSPIVMMGEEAPKHPEWVIPENPAYRERAVALWAAAGRSIGAFAKGGRTGGGVQQFDIGGFFGGIKDKVLGGAKSVISKLVLGGLGAISGTSMPKGMAGLLPFLLENALRYAKKKSGGGKMLSAAKEISGKYPYVYGGGHSGFAPSGGGFDCSGAVSYVLGKAGYISSPMTTDGLKTWADSGDGDLQTVGVRGSTGRSAHTMMRIGGKDSKNYFESGSGHGPLMVSGWAGRGFPIHRHSDATPGLASGGKWAPKPGRGSKGNWGYDAKSVPKGTQSKIAKLGVDAFMPDSNNFIGWGLRKGGLVQGFARGGRRSGGGGNQETIWRFLVGTMGLTPAQAAGVMGNIAHESNYDPGAIEGGGSGEGHGIVQWSFERRKALMAFAQKRGKPWSDLGVQLAFLQQEMKGPYSGAVSALKNTHDVASAASVWQRMFERPRVIQDRSGAARAAFNRFKGVSGTRVGTNADGSAADPEAGGPTPAQQRQRKKWEEEIKKNLSAIDKLNAKRRHLPGGKKGAAQRKAITDQIAELRSRNRLLQDRIRGIKETPTEGATSTAETAFTESQNAVQEAASTPELKDDQTAITNLVSKAEEYRKERAKRLAVVNSILGGKLNKGDRQKYLTEQQNITAAIARIDKAVTAAKGQGVVAKVGARFAGGRGAAGLEEDYQEAQITADPMDDIAALQQQKKYQEALAAAYTAIAPHSKKGKKFAGRAGDPAERAKALRRAAALREQVAKAQFAQQMAPTEWALAVAGSTEGLADDVAALNTQVAIWQQELARRTRSGDLAGMVEAQNAINGLSSNIAQANKTMMDAWERGNIDVAESISAVYDATDTIADDVAGATLLVSEYYAAMQRANSVGDYMSARAFNVQLINAQKRLRDAQFANQDLPLQARKAMAALTETTADDDAATRDMLAIAEGRLNYFKSIGDYANIIKYAGDVKSLKDELQQGESSRLESIRILSEARQQLYRSFGSNQISGGLAATGTVVNVTNNYREQPLDPHSWSRDIAFELRSAT